MRKTGYRFFWTSEARDCLHKIRKGTIQKQIVSDAEKLESEPNRGHDLVDELEGLRSLHTAQDKFRLIYKIDQESLRIIVLLVGPRRAGRSEDIYEVARKLLAAKLLKKDI